MMTKMTMTRAKRTRAIMVALFLEQDQLLSRTGRTTTRTLTMISLSRMIASKQHMSFRQSSVWTVIKICCTTSKSYAKCSCMQPLQRTESYSWRMLSVSTLKPTYSSVCLSGSLEKQYFGVPLQASCIPLWTRVQFHRPCSPIDNNMCRLQATRKKLMGIRDSLVASSMWKPAFKKPLETYPELEISQMDFAVPGCDACHMGARLSTRVAHLTGERYYERSYEVSCHTGKITPPCARYTSGVRHDDSY
jgi:hypothetical protein